ncbi:MAG: hypothetical protein ACJA0H_001598 [Francisellaceae bacterium]|jgi:hypothetical protein
MSSSDITNKNNDVLQKLKLKAHNKNLVSKKEKIDTTKQKKDKKLKTKQFTVYVTEDEYLEIEKNARNEYLSISQYIYKECKMKTIY